MTKEKTDIVLFETKDRRVSLPVEVKDETVWLNRNQMSELFDRDVKTIGKHINNAFKEELDKKATVAKFATVQYEGERKHDLETNLICLAERRMTLSKEV